MFVEIERKFLIKDNAWRPEVICTRHITDYLIARFEAGKARIRFCDDIATLTLKGQKRGLKRSEFHVTLKEAEACAMVREFVNAPGVEKKRHDVEVAGVTWQVDEYLGALDGLVTADVELPSEDFAFAIPSWAGREVTRDARFGASALIEAASRGPSALAEIFASAERP